MAKISGTMGPSSADVQVELATLIQKGKVAPTSTQLHEWRVWKLS